MSLACCCTYAAKFSVAGLSNTLSIECMCKWHVVMTVLYRAEPHNMSVYCCSCESSRCDCGGVRHRWGTAISRGRPGGDPCGEPSCDHSCTVALFHDSRGQAHLPQSCTVLTIHAAQSTPCCTSASSATWCMRIQTDQVNMVWYAVCFRCVAAS